MLRFFFIVYTANVRDPSLTRVGSDWYKVADIDWNQHIHLSPVPEKCQLK